MSIPQDTAGSQRPEPQVHDDPELRLVDNTDRDRVELWRGSTLIGFLGLERHTDGTVELQHTIIDERFGRQGYARTLVTLVLDGCQAAGVQVRPTCTYVQAYLQRFPQYQEIVAG